LNDRALGDKENVRSWCNLSGASIKISRRKKRLSTMPLHILWYRVFTAGIASQLGFLTMYTMLFALSVAFCTNARRVEVFAATAAYTAVLVVFVSGDLGGNKAEQCLVQLEGGIFKIVTCPG